jgi:hypothetical protein
MRFRPVAEGDRSDDAKQQRDQAASTQRIEANLRSAQ